jgi:menaquinone-9 beta-reductase
LTTNRKYDVAITGGGLAGISLSILLARKGWRVCLFEKEIFPFHKVCGEYISMESWDFLVGLGLPLEEWKLPRINELNITAPNGDLIQAVLPLGGFGISRYKLDSALAGIARSCGVDLLENTRVYDIHFEENHHRLETSAGLFTSLVACGCFGKKSNLDVKWKRSFLRKDENRNYVAIKYHVSTNLPDNQISLHNFRGGYCGISRIEDNRYCICYLTKSENLKNNGQSIPVMEENILKQNPSLRNLLDKVAILYDEPLAISQISFAKKTQIENHVLCIGDAAGMITPLCGNGMSMALHGSKLAAESINNFLANKISRQGMEKGYINTWRRHFAKRLRTGRIIQRFFGNPFWSSFLIRMVRPFPFFISALIRQTHGEKF